MLGNVINMYIDRKKLETQSSISGMFITKHVMNYIINWICLDNKANLRDLKAATGL